MGKGRIILATVLSLLLVVGVFAPVSAAFAGEPDEPKVYTFMLGVSADKGNMEEFWMFDEIVRLFNIRFDFIKVSSESFQEKKNIAFATDTLPDVFSWGLNDVEIATYGAQGLILPLEDYINTELTPHVMVWFDVVPGYESALYYPDGHIYNLQGFNIIRRELANQRYWINNDWAVATIGHLPATVDEYYEFLKGVKAMGDDKLPISGTFSGVGRQYSYFDGTLPILYGFGMTERSFEAFDGVVKYNPAEPVYKEYLKYMNKLYAEGLIDSEYFTQTTDQYRAKLGQGLVGAFTDYACWVGIPDADIWTQYSSNYPMTSQWNDVQRWGARDLALFGHFIITKECDDPGDLIRVADWGLAPGLNNPNDPEGTAWLTTFTAEQFQTMFYQPDGSLTKRMLEPGMWDRHPDVGNTIVEVTDSQGNTFLAWQFTNYPEDIYDSYQSAGKAMIGDSWDYLPPSWQSFGGESYFATANERQLTEDILKYNYPFYHTGWNTNIKFTADEADEMSLLEVDLTAYVDQMVSKFIIGELSVDGEFDNYVNECNRRGLTRILELYQVAYDRWASK